MGPQDDLYSMGLDSAVMLPPLFLTLIVFLTRGGKTKDRNVFGTLPMLSIPRENEKGKDQAWKTRIPPSSSRAIDSAVVVDDGRPHLRRSGHNQYFRHHFDVSRLFLPCF